jgi:hypothetical protein
MPPVVSIIDRLVQLLPKLSRLKDSFRLKEAKEQAERRQQQRAKNRRTKTTHKRLHHESRANPLTIPDDWSGQQVLLSRLSINYETESVV